MYTTLPRVLPLQRTVPFLQIQICPTFLTWALPVRNKWTAALSASFWKKLGVAGARQLKYAQIDVYSLFEKILLHEGCSHLCFTPIRFPPESNRGFTKSWHMRIAVTQRKMWTSVVAQLMVSIIYSLPMRRRSAQDWLFSGWKNCRLLSAVQTLPGSGVWPSDPSGPELNAGTIFSLA